MQDPSGIRLLDDRQLEGSAIVANNRMNRERKLFGINSYQKDLGFDAMEFLHARCQSQAAVHWMDLCCGNGNALIQAATSLVGKPAWQQMHLQGLDLVGIFPPSSTQFGDRLQLIAGAVAEWQPSTQYDLVTCVHGIHYLGDKLGLIRKVLGALKEDGVFVFNFDPKNFKDAEGQPLTNWWKKQCAQKGWRHSPRRHCLEVTGRQDLPPDWEYIGATDEAGPNYSGQPAVDSYYRPAIRC